MVSADTIRRWAYGLGQQADRFSLCESPQEARKMLATCECVRAAVTAYLIKHNTEDIHDGAK